MHNMKRDMSDEINEIRDRFQSYIFQNDVTLQAAAELVGWKWAGSVHKFLAGKHVPSPRRLYRIKKLLMLYPQGDLHA